MSISTTNEEEFQAQVEEISRCQFMGTKNDPLWAKFVETLPQKHWARYDIGATRLGWEAHKLLAAHEEIK
jgi:hypothetical protein